MNILEQEDIIKGLPDQALMMEASAPTGQVPQFLVISEIKRRADMRKRYENQQQQEQGTVKDQILAEAMGIPSVMPQQMAPPQQPMAPAGAPPMGAMPPPMGGMPPQGAPPMAPPMPQGGIASVPQAMPPMGMAQGGIVRMQQGGPTDLLDLIAAGASPVELLRRGYTQEQIRAAGAQYQAKMSAPIEVVGGMQQIQDSPTRTPQMGYGDQYDEPFVRGITDLIADKASDVAGAVGQGIESLGIAAEKNMPNYGLFGRNDLSLPSIPMPERRSQEAMAGMFSPDQIAERLANRPSFAGDLNMTPMDFIRQRVLGQGEAGDARVQGNTSAEVQPSSTTPSGSDLDFLNNPFPDAKDGTVADPVAGLVTTVAEAQDQVGRTPQRSSDSEGGIYGGAISSIDQMIADLSGRETQASPVLDLSDVIERSRKGTLAETFMRLGAGVAGGDISKGISGAADAASKGRQELSRLEMAERIAKTKAGQEDIRRGEQRDLDMARLGLQRGQLALMDQRLSNELGKAERVSKGQLFSLVSDLVKEATDDMMTEDRLEAVDRLSAYFMQKYAPLLDISLTEEDLKRLGTTYSGAGGGARTREGIMAQYGL